MIGIYLLILRIQYLEENCAFLRLKVKKFQGRATREELSNFDHGMKTRSGSGWSKRWKENSREGMTCIPESNVIGSKIL